MADAAAPPDEGQRRRGQGASGGGIHPPPDILAVVGSSGTGVATPAIKASRGFVRSPLAIAAEIDGEVVALDVEKGVCYGLDPIGSRIWSMLAVPTTIQAICAAMTGLYDVDEATCARDVGELLADLEAEGLVRPVADPAES